MRSLRAGLPTLLAALLAGTAVDVRAQVYVGAAADGANAIVLSNFRTDATPTLLVAPETPDTAPAAAAPPKERAPADGLSTIVEHAARQSGLSPLLIHAVIAAESAYDALAVSPRGAQGLMQLMPATASRFRIEHPFDPGENILAGARYLRWLADRFGGRLDLMLAAYNAGEGSVVRSGYRVPDFPETRRYVSAVLGRLQCESPSRCTPRRPAAPPTSSPTRPVAAGGPAAAVAHTRIEGDPALPT